MRFRVPSVFPPYWGWQRVAEVIVTVYQALVGFYFWSDTNALNHPPYAELHRIMPAPDWAILMWLVVLLHTAAIWLNGRASRISVPVRLVACLAHFWLVLKLAFGFWAAGYIWPVLTMGLILFLVWGAVTIAADDLAARIEKCRYPRS